MCPRFFGLTVLKTNLFVRFLEESEDTKNRFEIIWPLDNIGSEKEIDKYFKHNQWIVRSYQDLLTLFFQFFDNFLGGPISKINLRNSHRGILTAHNSCFFFVSYLFGSAIKKSVRKMPPSPSWSYNCWFMILTKRYIFVHTPGPQGA